MENKKILTIMVAFLIFQCFINGILIYRSINQNTDFETNMDILRGFSSGIKVLDKKIIETMNAHNREVESWYIGNKYIDDTTKKFFSEMKTLSNEENMNMTDFEACIADYEEYYQLLTPHITPDGDVDGYVIWMHDSQDFDGIGFIMFAKEHAKYTIYTCGGYYYNKTTEELTFIEPLVML
ncbi:MAG: hypothetical protein KAJ40_05725 [Alphaproteobacteria bacterium]|nr:hypothetical protein [Alphaproteobacteria bacterium]